jgi:hypothetical protein
MSSRRSRLPLVAAFSVLLAAAAFAAALLANSTNAASSTLYVSLSGSDGGVCLSSAPCKSFARAYAVASPGQTVQVAAGSYGDQQIAADSSKTSAADVVFAPAPGALVKVTALDIYGSHVEVGGLSSSGGWYVKPGAADVTLRDISAATWYAVRNASDVQVIGGDVGPGSDTTPQVTGSTNVTFDGVRFHDWRIKNDSSAHVDCLGLFGGNNHVAVRNSQFSNCQHYDTLVDKSVIATANNDVLFENNVYQAPGGDGYYALGYADCTACTLRNSTLTGALSVDNIGTISGLKITANTLNQINTANCSRATFTYNVYGSGSSCGGTGERVGELNYADAANNDYHLTSGSTAIDVGIPTTNAAATDADGDTRPAGTSPDAGAYEYGGQPSTGTPTQTTPTQTTPTQTTPTQTTPTQTTPTQTTPTQTTPTQPATPQLVGSWNFNEKSGSVAADASGQRNTGTIVGATHVSTGKHGYALKFNGTSNRVTVAESVSLDLKSGMTLEAWVAPSTITGYRSAIFKEDKVNGQEAYALYAANGNSKATAEVANGGGRTTLAGTQATATTSWTHLAETYDGSHLRVYVNGALVGDKTITGGLAQTSDVLSIGGNAVWSEWFKGLIDDVRVYNGALDATAIKADMATGA